MNRLAVPYFKIESFGAVDGPGIRLVIFVQGCYYRCLYCHNPESWDTKKNVKSISVEEIISLYLKNKEFYKNGGITISGGDPTLYLDFLKELAKKCHDQKISLAIDTAGVNFIPTNKLKFKQICKYKPLWIVDIKHINQQKHKQLTGVAEQREIKLIEFLDKNNQIFWIRQVFIPKITDSKNDLMKLGKFLKKLKNMEQFEFLPYHNLAIDKYKKLKIKYPLNATKLPTKKQITAAMNYILNKE